MNTQQMSEQSILFAIETLQIVQKSNPPTSREWLEASKVLLPLYAEMARRSKQAA